jgi:hypothetical protein
MSPRLPVRLFAVLILIPLGACGLPQASFNPRILNTDVSGSLLVTEGVATTASDVENLGMQSDSGNFAPRADFEWGAFHVTLSDQSTTHDGVGVADATLELDGITISGNENVATDFSLGLTNLAMTWDLFPGDTVEAGIGFGATLVDINAKIASLDNPGNDIATDEQVPVPMLSGRLGLNLGDFDIEGLLSGLSVNVDGNDATVIDLDIGLSYQLVDFGGKVMGSIGIGYKSFSVDVSYDDGAGGTVDLNTDFAGPYFGITLSI